MCGRRSRARPCAFSPKHFAQPLGRRDHRLRPSAETAPAAERTERLQEITAQVDLGHHVRKLPNQLSGGQRKRVALGRPLAVWLYVILFDNPLSNLDAKPHEQVRYEIREIQHEFGLTAIDVTHNQAEAPAMSDRIIIMKAGCLEQCGRPEEIYYRPRTRFVAEFVGSAKMPLTRWSIFALSSAPSRIF